MIALQSRVQLHRNNIKTIRITSIMQSFKNPFRSKVNHILHMDSCKFDAREYFNYKQINEDSPIDYEVAHIQHQSDGAIFHKKTKKPLISRETEDMRIEIQLNTSLSPEIENELQKIFTLKRISQSEINAHRVRLPISRHKITLFVDLDETLICSQTCPFSKEFDLSKVYTTKCYNSISQTSTLVYFAVRPFCREFLQSVSANFDVVVFTAAEKDYADSILNIIDPGHLISCRLYRHNCILRDMHHIKDLRIVDRDLKQCVAIDNSVIAFMEQLDNLIPIPVFTGSSADTELIDIASFLETIKHTSDVSKYLSTKYCLSQIYNHLNF